jgi:hypothetical protein
MYTRTRHSPNVHSPLTLGIRLTKTDRFGSSVIQQISVPWEEGTDRLLRKRGTDEFRFRVIRFGFGSNRGNRKFQNPINSPFNCKFQQHFAWFSSSQQGQFKEQCSIKQQYNTYMLLFSQIQRKTSNNSPTVIKQQSSSSLQASSRARAHTHIQA